MNLHFIGEGYSVAEAARFAGTTGGNVARWFRGLRRGEKAYPPLFSDRRRPFGEPISLSFLEVIEVIAVAAFKREGVSPERIRNARDFSLVHLTDSYPFASYDFKVRGARILHDYEQQHPDEQSGSMVVDIGDKAAQWKLNGFDDLADAVIEYGEPNRMPWAVRYYPRGRDGHLVVDPRYGSGRVTMIGHNLLATVVAGRYSGGDSIDFIAEDYELDREAVEAAIAYCESAA